MCKLIGREEFHKADPRYQNTSDSSSDLTRLESFRKNVENIHLSPYLHPDVEEYVYRMLNTYLHGWYYYPFFTVAESMSYVVLELALNRRYEYQTVFRKNTLNQMLKRALNEGDINLKESSKVKSIFQHQMELHTDALYPVEKPSQSKIADGRGKVLLDCIPKLRGYSVHPEITPLSMPSYSIYSIRETVELVNIMYEKNTRAFRDFSEKSSFDWSTSIKYEPSKSSSEMYISQSFMQCKSTSLKEITQMINLISEFFGLLEMGTFDQIRLQEKLGLLPSKSSTVLQKLYRENSSQSSQMISDRTVLKAMIDTEDHYRKVLSRFNPIYKLATPLSSLSIALEKVKSRKRWRITSSKLKDEHPLFIPSKSMLYYRFLKLGTRGHIPNSLNYELGFLCRFAMGTNRVTE